MIASDVDKILFLVPFSPRFSPLFSLPHLFFFFGSFACSEGGRRQSNGKEKCVNIERDDEDDSDVDSWMCVKVVVLPL